MWMIQMMESGDLLQRRGRWANRKMMDIYVQEVSALLYLKKVAEATKAMADAFPGVFCKAETFVHANILTSAWHILFQVGQ